MTEGAVPENSPGGLQAELRRIDQALEQHPALVVSQQMEEFHRARQWYVTNAEELLQTINALNEGNLGIRLMVQGELAFEDEHRDYVVELGRKWHNYVAAANTVVDHMRELFKEQPADLRGEYEQKKAELLAPHDVVGFISRSRNVLLHKGVFTTGITWRFASAKGSSTGNTFEVNCRTDILLNRYESWWTAAARRYIESKAPRLALGAAVEEYAEAVEPLQQWFDDRFHQYHFASLSDFEQLAAQYRSAQEQLEPGSLPPPDESAHFIRPEEREQAKKQPSRAPAKRRSKSKAKGRGKKRKRR